VVAALWEVPDGATFELMRGFYEQLAAGAPRAEALRRAKLERLERGAPPRAWAGLVLVGDGESPLRDGWRSRDRRDTRWFALLAGLAAGGATLLWAGGKVRRER
jgi:hypothetical protein